MLAQAAHMRGLTIRATDGDFGEVDDCYFDGSDWIIRYIVVEAGAGPSRRQVLIPPAAVQDTDWNGGVLHVGLARDQIETSTDVATDKAASRRLEKRLRQHYGWPIGGAPKFGSIDASPSGQSLLMSAQKGDRGGDNLADELIGDPHLRSSREVTGYHVHASDGEIGRVEDLVVDIRLWTIRFVVVDTRDWLAGRRVLVAPNCFRLVDWSKRMVRLDLTRDAVRNSPGYTPSQPIDEMYAAQLHAYYARPVR